MQLLLISNGYYESKTYLKYARTWISKHFYSSPERRKKLLFVPYAQKDGDAYVARVGPALDHVGIDLVPVHTESRDPDTLLDKVDGVFVAGGNTFRLLDMLQKTGWLPAIRDKVRSGMPYMGVSAGTNVAAPTIKTTNDMPIVWLASPEAFGFVPFQINPHYVPGKFYYEENENGPKLVYNGETRDERLKQYLEENDVPVLALREGTALRIWDASIELLGNKAAQLFVKGDEPRPVNNAEIRAWAETLIYRAVANDEQ
jgi:dipeptidase E